MMKPFLALQVVRYKLSKLRTTYLASLAKSHHVQLNTGNIVALDKVELRLGHFVGNRDLDEQGKLTQMAMLRACTAQDVGSVAIEQDLIGYFVDGKQCRGDMHFDGVHVPIFLHGCDGLPELGCLQVPQAEDGLL